MAMLLAVVAMAMAAAPGVTAADRSTSPMDFGKAMQDRAVSPPGASPLVGDTGSRSAGRYIVVLKDSVEHPGAVAKAQSEQNDGELGFVYRSVLTGYSVAGLSKKDLASLRRDPKVDYVWPDRQITLFAQTIPEGIERISATSNPYLDIDGQDDSRINADVAVIDTGIDYTHPDLNVVARFNCISEEINSSTCVENSGTDGVGHGTHVAGTIGAIDNGIGVVGVAPGARLWSFKVFDDYGGGGWDAWIIAAIEKITSNASSIEVVNMSLGGFGKSPPLEAAIKSSVEKGVVYVVSAGNEKSNAASVSPANDPNVITVSALADYDGKPGGLKGYTCNDYGGDDTLAAFSNWGSKVDVAAPGVCVYSTLPGGSYGNGSGTSMAAPHVAGAVAAMASISNPSSKADVEAIRSQLTDNGSLEWIDTARDGEVEPILNFHPTPLSKIEAATAGISAIAPKSVTLHGSVTARGLPTVYQFEYGPTTEYGQSYPAAPKSLSQIAHHTSVQETISGLTPGQTYHFRLVATNNSGVAYGADRTFTAPRWSEQSPPAQPVQEWLIDVSCSGPTFCMTVGYRHETGIISFERTPSGWVQRSVPTPSGIAVLNAVECTAATACTAVGGRYNDLGIYVPWAARWNGAAWSTQSIPEPSGYFTLLDDLACPSSSECIAVGHYRSLNQDVLNYSVKWNGTSWSQLEIPTEADSMKSKLNGISCASSTFCKAVGSYTPLGEGADKTVIVSWNGASWSLETPATTQERLYAVSCPSTSFCMAVGRRPGAEIWNGSTWSISTVPLSTGFGQFSDVSCTSPNACTAMGNSVSGPRTSGFLQVWDGTAWGSQQPVQRSEDKDFTTGLSCAALAGCAVVGDFFVGGVDKLAASWLEGADSLIAVREGVLVEPATGVTPSEATLNGVINPGGLETTYRFEYGKTTSYGAKVPSSDASISGPGGVDVSLSQSVSGLEPNTTYHYRLAATNSAGTVFSKDGTFSTPPLPGSHLSTMPVTESFDGSAGSVARFAADWSPLAWSGGSTPKGASTSAGWQPTAPYPTVNGAYYHKPIVDTGQGIATSVTMAVNPGVAGRYFSLWLDVAGSLSTRTGYELRFTVVSANTYNVTLSKWKAGDQTVLASKSSYGLVNGNSVAVTDELDTVSAWVNAGSGFQQILTASDTSFNAGNAGIEGMGSFTRLKNWKVSNPFSPTYSSSWGSKGSGQGQFNAPVGVGVLPFDQSLAVVDYANAKVQTFTPGGGFVRQFGSEGSGNGQFKGPNGIATDSKGNIWVADTSNHRIQQFTETGTFIRAIGSKGTANGQFEAPYGVAVDSDGNVWVADFGNNRVQQFSEGGTYLRQFSTGGSPVGVDVDPKGNVWSSDWGATGVIEVHTPTGELIRSFGEYGSGKGKFWHPRGLFADSSGLVWIADSENHMVEVYTELGAYLTSFGTKGAGAGQLQYPSAVTLDSAGNVWIADYDNFRIGRWKR